MKMIKAALAATLLAVLATPALAQDDGDAQAMQQMAQIFRADPLTAEQQLRLPASEVVVQKIFPPGTYIQMMNETLRPMMDQMMAQMGNLPLKHLVAMAGVSEDEIAELGDGTLAELAQIMDPAYQQRQKIIADETMNWMAQLMDTVEPSFRAGLARAYAVRFSESELADMSAFFDTPSGGKYASQSMLIMTDRQVMAAMSEMMPAMFDMMPVMTQAIQERTASLPPARDIDDLSDEERARIAELLGVPGGETQ
ncbi:DUF2059 domain-containing protein [Erythrobacteraceae bacterium E2-1 Yellow Sea]|nr:DUF2059 domain-containing protein [Erythrobacteraceae bacterium E2-1 Yellow Sea]